MSCTPYLVLLILTYFPYYHHQLLTYLPLPQLPLLYLTLLYFTLLYLPYCLLYVCTYNCTLYNCTHLHFNRKPYSQYVPPSANISLSFEHRVAGVFHALRLHYMTDWLFSRLGCMPDRVLHGRLWKVKPVPLPSRLIQMEGVRHNR